MALPPRGIFIQKCNRKETIPKRPIPRLLILLLSISKTFRSFLGSLGRRARLPLVTSRNRRSPSPAFPLTTMTAEISKGKEKGTHDTLDRTTVFCIQRTRKSQRHPRCLVENGQQTFTHKSQLASSLAALPSCTNPNTNTIGETQSKLSEAHTNYK